MSQVLSTKEEDEIGGIVNDIWIEGFRHFAFESSIPDILNGEDIEVEDYRNFFQGAHKIRFTSSHERVDIEEELVTSFETRTQVLLETIEGSDGMVPREVVIEIGLIYMSFIGLVCPALARYIRRKSEALLSCTEDLFKELIRRDSAQLPVGIEEMFGAVSEDAENVEVAEKGDPLCDFPKFSSYWNCDAMEGRSRLDQCSIIDTVWLTLREISQYPLGELIEIGGGRQELEAICRRFSQIGLGDLKGIMNEIWSSWENARARGRGLEWAKRSTFDIHRKFYEHLADVDVVGVLVAQHHKSLLDS